MRFQKFYIFLITYFFLTNSVQAQVSISEIMPNPIGKDSGQEWIELANTTEQTITLTNAEIRINNKTTKLENTTFPANSYAIFKKISFPNNSGEIKLILDGHISAQASYSKAPEGKSYSKTKITSQNTIKKEYLWTEPTPGNPNKDVEAIQAVIGTPTEFKIDQTLDTFAITKDLQPGTEATLYMYEDQLIAYEIESTLEKLIKKGPPTAAPSPPNYFLILIISTIAFLTTLLFNLFSLQEPLSHH